MILGTAAYMAPEQARGKPVDKRVDIWAFGCVLYEMLAGIRAFDGEDVAVVLASVIKGEPDWAALPDKCPGAIHTLLRRCLEKDGRNGWPTSRRRSSCSTKRQGSQVRLKPDTTYERAPSTWAGCRDLSAVALAKAEADPPKPSSDPAAKLANSGT